MHDFSVDPRRLSIDPRRLWLLASLRHQATEGYLSSLKAHGDPIPLTA